MKQIFTAFSLLLFFTGSIVAQSAWHQISDDIDGEAILDMSGRSVSLNSDGSIVAIGAYGNDGYLMNAGHVRVYQYNSGSWVQLGADIDGEAAGDKSGYSVSLSSDGSTVAIGAYGNGGNGSYAGHVRVYQYNSDSWMQLGADIDGEAEYDYSGSSVSLSSDGSTVVIGAYGNEENGEYAGHVRVYQYNSGSWVQLGTDIDGEAEGDYSGNSVSLSSDGSIVAIGAYYNDGNGSYAGHVRVYQYNSGSWVQLGADIDGEAEGDCSGSSVSLSSDGSIVAIGAKGNDGNGSDAGHVRVYQYNSGSWAQLGADIDGEAEGDYSGNSVSLSSDGSVVAIGAYYNDGNGSDAGQVRVYQYSSGSWAQLGADIDGEAEGDYSGISVSLSSDGSVVAIGANYNDGIAKNAGHTRVYCIYGISTQPVSQTGLCLNSNASFSLVGDDISSYQWQVKDPDANSFSNISNNDTYSGATTAQLSISSVTTDINNYQYRCSVTGTYVTTILISDTVSLALETEKPTISSTIEDQSVYVGDYCSATLADYTGIVSANDNCTASSDLTITQSPEAGTSISGSTNTVTITVTDEVGNSGTVSFNVEVVDNISPTISSTIEDQSLDAGEDCSATLADYTTIVEASDNCSSSLTITQSPEAGASISGSTNTVTITVTDEAGNSSDVSFNVAVVDNTAPTVSMVDQSADAGEDCSATLADYTTTVEASDNCSSSLTITQSPEAGTSISGSSNTVTITVTDEAGNSSDVTFNVAVVDNTAPTISSTIEDQSLDAGEDCSATLANYTTAVEASDNCSSSLTITQSPEAGTGISGSSNTVTITVTDDAGNSSEVSFNVAVSDAISPVITCVSDQSFDLGSGETVYTISGTGYDATATDNCGVSSIVNDFNNAESLEGAELSAGTTTIVWIVEDEAGNTTNCSFDITVNAAPSGLNAIHGENITIYPNPVSDALVINLTGNEDVIPYKIVSLTGKTLVNGEIENGSTSIDMSHLDAGIYFLQLEHEDKAANYKIVKE